MSWSFGCPSVSIWVSHKWRNCLSLLLHNAKNVDLPTTPGSVWLYTGHVIVLPQDVISQFLKTTFRARCSGCEERETTNLIIVAFEFIASQSIFCCFVCLLVFFCNSTTVFLQCQQKHFITYSTKYSLRLTPPIMHCISTSYVILTSVHCHPPFIDIYILLFVLPVVHCKPSTVHMLHIT